LKKSKNNNICDYYVVRREFIHGGNIAGFLLILLATALNGKEKFYYCGERMNNKKKLQKQKAMPNRTRYASNLPPCYSQPQNP
jgi:hypothetical protein